MVSIVDGSHQIRCMSISLAGFLGLLEHRQLVLERDDTKVTRVWEWGKGLQEGLGRASHGVRKIFTAVAGDNELSFGRCASLELQGGVWDGTGESGVVGSDKRCAMGRTTGACEGRGNRCRSTFVVNDAHSCRAAVEKSRRR